MAKRTNRAAWGLAVALADRPVAARQTEGNDVNEPFCHIARYTATGRAEFASSIKNAGEPR
jgi:hypothetical protein